MSKPTRQNDVARMPRDTGVPLDTFSVTSFAGDTRPSWLKIYTSTPRLPRLPIYQPNYLARVSIADKSDCLGVRAAGRRAGLCASVRGVWSLEYRVWSKTRARPDCICLVPGWDWFQRSWGDDFESFSESKKVMLPRTWRTAC